jgi:hypothetical protein
MPAGLSCRVMMWIACCIQAHNIGWEYVQAQAIDAASCRLFLSGRWLFAESR